jgi:hypothetical protein
MDIQTAAPVAAASSGPSAVSWGAVIAGAVVASAVSLLLLVLAAGLNLASFSLPPLRHGSAVAVTALAAITLIVTQWIASAVGGYLTGRLRTRWVGTHTHEVFFRDTAHGFITWSLATLFLAFSLGSATNSLMGVGLTGAIGSTLVTHKPAAAFPVTAQRAIPAAQVEEVLPAAETVPTDDNELQLVLPPAQQPGAERMTLVQDPQEGRDEGSVLPERARKDAAFSSLMIALSMVVGAFIACVAAAAGGHRRDLHP